MRRQRKLIQPSFHHDQFAKYSEIPAAHALRAMDSFRDGEVREMNAEMMKPPLSVVVKSFFAAEFTRETEETGMLMIAVPQSCG